MKSSIKIFLISMLSVFIFTACCEKKQIIKKEVNKPAPTKQVKKEPVKKPCPVKKSPPSLPPVKIVKTETMPMIHKVVKGECLWIISSYKDIYNDPFMWPLIYKANKDKIKDPDLIFPGQVLYIDRDFSSSDKAKAVHFAKTRGKWSLWDGK